MQHKKVMQAMVLAGFLGFLANLGVLSQQNVKPRNQLLTKFKIEKPFAANRGKMLFPLVKKKYFVILIIIFCKMQVFAPHEVKLIVFVKSQKMKLNS